MGDGVGSPHRIELVDQCTYMEFGRVNGNAEAQRQYDNDVGQNLGRRLKLAVENKSAPSKLRRADRRLIVHGINKRNAEHPSTDGPPRRVLGAATDRADRFDQRTSELR